MQLNEVELHKQTNSLTHSHLAKIGPSGVRALPLAAGINESGNYFWYIIPLLSFLVTAVVKIPEGVVVVIQIFAWAPN